MSSQSSQGSKSGSQGSKSGTDGVPAGARGHGLPPLRLTVRGRRVVTVLAAAPLVLAALAFALNGGMATATSGSGSAAFHGVTVPAGQSLWQLAASLAPTADPRDVVSDIVHLNQLDSADVQAGQVLAIPQQYAR